MKNIIKFKPKNLIFQFAMFCFLLVSLTRSDFNRNVLLILAYLSLLLWEYSLTGFVTIDLVIWNIVFIVIHLRNIHEEYIISKNKKQNKKQNKK
jgi:hypothetical protein